MDEIQVLSLIANEENENLDFKRQLNLDSATQKAEFIKDVIAIANSSSERGNLLIGIANDKQLVGIKDLDEERIQQIAHSYISPSVKLSCFIIPISTPTLTLIGVIEITPGKKPHKVARPIDRLRQDEVFVRRGSITTNANPDEIIEMDKLSSSLEHLVLQYTQSAEIHSKTNNWRFAIKSLTKALELIPSAELFLSRGLECEKGASSIKNRFSEDYENLGRLANADFSSAIILAGSNKELEVKARTGRFRNKYSTYDELEEDLKWLKENANNRQLGEALYLEVTIWDWGDRLEVAKEAVVQLSTSIALGYDEPDVYNLRSSAQAELKNYSLALDDINQAINKSETANLKIPADYYGHRAFILIELKRYAEAKKDFNLTKVMGDTTSEPEYISEHLLKAIGMYYYLGYINNRKLWAVITKLLYYVHNNISFELKVNPSSNNKDVIFDKSFNIFLEYLPSELQESIEDLLLNTQSNK